MGKWYSNEQNFIERNIKQYVKRTTEPYIRYVEGRPNFVTYYNQDRLHSTYDRGLENIEEDLGRDSPLRFKRIENFPLFNMDQLSLDVAVEDEGLSSSMSGSAIILPGTIKPYVYDFFVFPYIGQLYHFRVNNVIPDTIKSKPIYRIEFNFERIVRSAEEFSDQITESYTFIYKNLGTSYKPLIENTEYYIIEYLSKILFNYKNYYISTFYDNAINAPILEYYDSNEEKYYYLYNEYLLEFIESNALFRMSYGFLEDYVFTNIYEKRSSFYNTYKTTIFAALELGTAEYLDGEYVLFLPICKEHKPFDYYLATEREFMRVDYVPNSAVVYHWIPFDTDFFSNIRTGNCYDDNDTHFFENIVIRYLNNELNFTIPLLEQIFKRPLHDDTYKNYHMVPLVMYLMRTELAKRTKLFYPDIRDATKLI